MAYSLSATKLQTYSRCPRAYYYRYEYGLKGAGMFGSAALGNALHRALDHTYKDWRYNKPLPPLEWLERCRLAQQEGLSDKQMDEGWRILLAYYEQHIAGGRFRRPIATEGRIDGSLIAAGVEFKLTGRYDRLNALPDGGELIDYKIRQASPAACSRRSGPSAGAVLYALALEQRYGQSFKSMQLVYLRTGQVISFEVTPAHRQQVEATVGQLALKLSQDDVWQPSCGESCARCSYAQYCSAITDSRKLCQNGSLEGDTFSSRLVFELSHQTIAHLFE